MSNNSTTTKSCMIYLMVPFPVTLSDTYPRFQGHGVIFMPIDVLSVLCAQLTRDLLAIAKFLFIEVRQHDRCRVPWNVFFVLLMQCWLRRTAAFVSFPIHVLNLESFAVDLSHTLKLYRSTSTRYLLTFLSF